MSNVSAKVFFIAESTRFDISSAKRFGVPTFLMGMGSSSPFNPDGFFAELEHDIDTHGFNPETDFIAMTGPAVHMALFVGFMLRKYDELNLLIFDARSSRYRKRHVSFGEDDE